MEPAFFLIAILGCGEGDAPCAQVRRLDARYESRAACMTATDAAMTAHSGIDYPVVVAECRPGELGASTGIKADEVKRPAPPSARIAAFTREG